MVVYNGNKLDRLINPTTLKLLDLNETAKPSMTLKIMLFYEPVIKR